MSDNFDKRIEEATAVRDAAQEELTQLETTLQEQRNKLSANQTTIAKGLSGLALDKLLEHGQKISMSQQEVENLTLIIGELERRVSLAKQDVHEKTRTINRIKAEEVDGAARALEDEACKLFQQLLEIGEQIDDLNHRFATFSGLTRQPAFSNNLLIERPQHAIAEYEKDRQTQRPRSKSATWHQAGVVHSV